MKTNQTKPNYNSTFSVRCSTFAVRLRPPFTLLLLVLFLASTANTLATVRYVDVNSASPAPPYTNWATAARVIQAAVEAGAPGDETVATNGAYATGGRAMGTNRLPNRVIVN